MISKTLIMKEVDMQIISRIGDQWYDQRWDEIDDKLYNPEFDQIRSSIMNQLEESVLNNE
jgi:hypothetical protein